MKKIIALVLALTMVFSMALTVSAKESYVEKTPYTFTDYTSQGVKVVITMSGLNVVHTYAFDIEYGSMEFNYGKEMTWNPETYQYVASKNGEDWNANGTNKITVVNHSDLPIICEAKGEVTESQKGSFELTFSHNDVKISDNGVTIAGCKVGDKVGSNFCDITVNLSGKPIISSGTRVEIGQVSVTIKKDPTNNNTTNAGSNTGSNTGSTDGSNGEPTSNAQ
jgi:hypothetical protein